MELFLYVFKLENGKYYLGFTTDYERVFVEFRAGFGPEWVKLHKPISVDLIIENAEGYLETAVLYEYFKKYGIDNVRGGPYSNVSLTTVQLDSIKNALNICDETDDIEKMFRQIKFS